MHKEVFVECPRCGRSYKIHKKLDKDLKHELTKRGWFQNGAMGFICPKCKKELGK